MGSSLLCGLSLLAVHGLLVAVASLFLQSTGSTDTRASVLAAHGLRSCSSQALEHGLSGRVTRVSLLLGIWDPPRSVIEPMSPALASRFLPTVPPGRSPTLFEGFVGMVTGSSWVFWAFIVFTCLRDIGGCKFCFCIRGFPDNSVIKESACNAGDPRLIPGLGTSPGEGKGYPLQYSGLENSMDCIVHGVAKSQTRLSDFHCVHFTLYTLTQKKSCHCTWLHGNVRH